MLIRDQRIYYRLWTVFTHGSFVLKNYKTLSEGSELALSPVEGLERVIVNLTAPMRVDGRSLSEMDMIYVPPGEGASIELPGGSSLYIAEAPPRVSSNGM